MWATIKKWAEIVGGFLVVIGGAIVAIVWEKEKASKPAPTATTPATNAVEGQIAAHQAELPPIDAAQAALEAKMKKEAEDAKKASSQPPGDAGAIANSINNAM